ncbi:MAG: GIY-YIG nuclease family protein [Bacteroidetes bacterium]|nr:GIY-YIG nuclease family protein [Bacteroidota bacterium]
MSNTNEIPEIPCYKDYEDKRQYKIDYLRWRRKYDNNFRETNLNRVKAKYHNDPATRDRHLMLRKSATYTVYKITNSINDFVYIGSTGYRLTGRLSSHYASIFSSDRKSKFFEFVRSVSDKNSFYEIFKIEPIIEGIETKQQAIQMEIKTIQYYISNGIELLNTEFMASIN